MKLCTLMALNSDGSFKRIVSIDFVDDDHQFGLSDRETGEELWLHLEGSINGVLDVNHESIWGNDDNADL